MKLNNLKIKMVSICLNMIVKNESHVILETLQKLTAKVKFNHYIISDTGSDDNTPEIIKNYFNEKPSSILDIACNDGTQLNSYKKFGLETFGIDPAENLLKESSLNHDVICDYFPSDKLNRKYSIITAQNVFAHTHDIFSFLKGCSEILDDKGIRDHAWRK